MADYTSNFESPGGYESAEHSAGDFHEAVRELCIRIVAAGVPYAWGGGALDGPSRGVSDGGGYIGVPRCGGFQCRWFGRSQTGQDRKNRSRFCCSHRTDQRNFCTPTDNPQIGDLGWPPGGNPGHVVICVGDGQVCEAQQSGTNIMFSDDRGFVYGYVPGGPNDPNANRK